MDSTLFSTLTPWAAMLLRVWCGLALLPHGMRCFFGWFPNSGSRILTPALLATGLERSGFRPGRYWVVYVALVEFVAGPALALGLFTHLAGALIFLFFVGAAYDHLRFDGYFWNKLGMEYPALWGLVALFFACAGGGAMSLDRLFFGAMLVPWQVDDAHHVAAPSFALRRASCLAIKHA